MAKTTAPTGERPASLAGKIAMVMGRVGYLKKDAANQHERYSYVTEAAVMANVRRAMADAGLVVLPPSVIGYQIIQPKEVESAIKNPLVVVQYDITLAHADGDETLTRQAYGCANLAASRDKWPYVAQTGAEKYFLTKLFLLPTGDAEPEDPAHGDTGQYVDLSNSLLNWLKTAVDGAGLEAGLRKVDSQLMILREKAPGIFENLMDDVRKMRVEFKTRRTQSLAGKVRGGDAQTTPVDGGPAPDPDLDPFPN